MPVRYWLRSALGGSFGGDRARQTLEREWPKAKRELDAGRVVLIGLIRVASVDPRQLTMNHQVMAWGYAEDGRGVTLNLYDPNWPDRDDVTITIQLDPALRPTASASRPASRSSAGSSSPTPGRAARLALTPRRGWPAATRD